MKNCWANGLGNCSDQISLEHYISQGIFDDKSIIIQIFNYNLPIIDNVLHPLSIYLIFKEDNDSRIKYEMKTMIDNYFRNLEI